MVNLNIYDKVEVSHNRTWIEKVYKKLYSREIPHYSAYTILRRFNPKDRCYDIFLVVTSAPDSEHLWNCITETKSGIIKINLSPYWHILNMTTKPDEFEVVIDKVDEDENTIVYYLDI